MSLKTISLFFFFAFVLNAHCFAQSQWDDSLNTMSSRLGDQINHKYPKSNIYIPDFIDVADSSSQLGKYIALVLRANLVNNLPGRIVDRRLSNELKDEDFSRKHQAIELGSKEDEKFKGIDFFLMGTTVSFRNHIEVIIEVVDFRKGVSVASERCKLIIDNSDKSNGENLTNVPAAIAPPYKIDTKNQSASDFTMKAQVSDLRSGECTKNWYGDNVFYGQICFENQTGEDLIYYCNEFNPSERLDDYVSVITTGSVKCSRLIAVNWTQRFNVDENLNKEATFTFYSMDKKRTIKMSFMIDRCKVKSIVLTKKNTVLLPR